MRHEWQEMKTTSTERRGGGEGGGGGREKVTARTQRRSLYDWSVGGKHCAGVVCTIGIVPGDEERVAPLQPLHLTGSHSGKACACTHNGYACLTSSGCGSVQLSGWK